MENIIKLNEDKIWSNAGEIAGIKYDEWIKSQNAPETDEVRKVYSAKNIISKINSGEIDNLIKFNEDKIHNEANEIGDNVIQYDKLIKEAFNHREVSQKRFQENLTTNTSSRTNGDAQINGIKGNFGESSENMTKPERVNQSLDTKLMDKLLNTKLEGVAEDSPNPIGWVDEDYLFEANRKPQQHNSEEWLKFRDHKPSCANVPKLWDKYLDDGMNLFTAHTNSKREVAVKHLIDLLGHDEVEMEITIKYTDKMMHTVKTMTLPAR
jgi:hypothetical protein